MNRRKFLSTTSTLAAACSLMPSTLLAASKLSENIYSAPAMPSILVAKAAASTSASVKIWRNPDELRSGVASGAFRLMMSPANVCAMLAAKGFDVGYVNFLTTGMTSVLSRGEALMQLEDLKGRKIIMPFKNDMPDIVLKTLCKHHNIGDLDITYAATPSEAMALFLAKSEFDAAYLPEPAASACVLKAKMNALTIYRGLNSAEIWKQSFGTHMYQAGMIARRDFAMRHLQELEDFNRELAAALEWAQDNQTAAANLGASLLNMPAPALKAALNHSNLCAVPASSARSEVMEFLKILHAYNPALIGGKLPSEGIFLL